MTKEQVDHLTNLLITANGLINDKYRRGAVEHENSDPLLEMTQLELVDNAISEGIDQLIYLLTLKRMLK